jgi:hypothetical protein
MSQCWRPEYTAATIVKNKTFPKPPNAEAANIYSAPSQARRKEKRLVGDYCRWDFANCSALIPPINKIAIVTVPLQEAASFIIGNPSICWRICLKVEPNQCKRDFGP